ncbi:nucleotidyl transferase AbiEii/AbiGii toxin family protein [Selenomonas sp. oral taxon 149]|uniref:nucleotidyl transferase AbiEii/AbiGii toxin family protein n=1 Tax=Selenomonas sp. oral taxon 149 TaxID=712535 RepID=UPI0001E0D369|nr:nucleotidyl transferase AbiEii/AbiGii toxin family protein [Selenomonas sp. oral taxon 149]EFM22546.1 hypothetical protein HMPREF9166_1788 [Selenomonas sp. oral taxon 149 str. 67H29BP]
MRTSEQLKAHIRNRAKATNVQAEILLRSFMMERFLERIAHSSYRHHFILKGGMLIAAMVGIAERTTMDMDATLKGRTLNASEITAMIEEILSIPMDDGVFLTMHGIEEIREETDYPGFRISISARLDKTRQMLKIDITTGDFVTPREIIYPFKLMFEDRSIDIMAYNVETILAEKFETIITRSTANTRMRDFYDIYILTVSHPFDPEIFRTALQNTAERRGTSAQMTEMDTIIHMVADSPQMRELWRRYQSKYSYATNVTWEMATAPIVKLTKDVTGAHLMPPSVET